MKKLAIVMLIATFAVLQGTAYAEIVKGNVVTVDSVAKSLTISRVDVTTGVQETSVVSITDTTAFSGAASLDELKRGDEVWIDATEDPATKSWVATSVNRSLLQPSEGEVPAAETPAAGQ